MSFPITLRDGGEGQALQQVVDSLFQTEFARTNALHTQLQAAAQLALQGAKKRVVREAFRAFLEAAGPDWKRYELYVRYWTLKAPRERKPWEVDDDEFDPCPYVLSREDALMHWIVMSVYALTWRARARNDADRRPYWRLSSEICPWPDHSRRHGYVVHHSDKFWTQTMPAIGARLDCRCRVTALPSPADDGDFQDGTRAAP